MRSEPFRRPGALLFLLLPLACQPASQDSLSVPQVADDRVAAATVDEPGALRDAVFAGGCFWCTEAVFEDLTGVEDVVSGYAGGTPETADYKLVSAGQTDHAEVIRITYDPSVVSYGKLLEVFFSVAHDPTQLDRQGPDWGRQYRSAVFYADDEEKQTVAAYIRQLDESGAYSDPVVTTLEPLEAFHPAEDYHQDFVRLNPRHPYVVQQALPKVEKLKKGYGELVAPRR